LRLAALQAVHLAWLAWLAPSFASLRQELGEIAADDKIRTLVLNDRQAGLDPMADRIPMHSEIASGLLKCVAAQ
jgi:hypothetical protein